MRFGELLMTRILEYSITEQYASMTIGAYLKSLGFSRQCIIALKKQENGILLNGIWSYVNTTLSTGDKLTLTLCEEETSEKYRFFCAMMQSDDWEMLQSKNKKSETAEK